MTPTQEAIVRAAQEDGIDPAYALAVAERESSFNPRAHSSKTIHGIYQMRGDLRTKYGVGDSNEPYDQAKGWMRSVPDLKRDMGGVLGRDATDQESYLGHHFGARRAARMLKMDPETPVATVFTPQEMEGNPHFARAGTVGRLNGSVMADIGKRMARFGGDIAPVTSGPADLSSFGEPAETSGSTAEASSKGQGGLPDLSSFGTPVEPAAELRPSQQAETLPKREPAGAAAGLPDLSSYGTLAA